MFVVRIELPDAAGEKKPDYVTLHQKMKGQGFFNKIKFGDGERSLPHATYSHNSGQGVTLPSILEKAEAAAAGLCSGKPRILAMEVGQAAQSGLPTG
jgi:hypothetical protein